MGVEGFLQSHTLKFAQKKASKCIILRGGDIFLSEKSEVLTATNSKGDTSVMVCKSSQESSNQKRCMDIQSTANQASITQKSSSGKAMLDNETYDLLEQLLVENKSLWRIKNNYKADAGIDKEVKEVWNFIENNKEEIIKVLTEKVKERL